MGLARVRTVVIDPIRDVVLNHVLASPLWHPRLRVRLLALCGLDVKGSHIYPGCVFGGTAVSIGPATFVNRQVLFDTQARIRIGEGCAIGPRVQFITSYHESGPARSRAGAVRGAPITVGAGCWIGAGAIVLPGVVIGEGAVIGAGAVVTRDCPPNGLYAGNPAKLLRALDPGE